MHGSFSSVPFLCWSVTQLELSPSSPNRLFNWQTPRLLRVLANYVSAVKLYTQRRRFGVGFLWHREEFLDSIGEPPRVSIRRRIIRAIADVAANKYDRWYIRPTVRAR